MNPFYNNIQPPAMSTFARGLSGGSVIFVGVTQNLLLALPTSCKADCVHERVEKFLESGLPLLLALLNASYVLSQFLLLPSWPTAGKT